MNTSTRVVECSPPGVKFSRSSATWATKSRWTPGRRTENPWHAVVNLPAIPQDLDEHLCQWGHHSLEMPKKTDRLEHGRSEHNRFGANPLITEIADGHG